MTQYEKAVKLWQGKKVATAAELGERPGAFKLRDYVTGRSEIGAAPDDVEAEVAELLEAWDTEQELEPLVKFLQEQTAKTWAKQIQRAEKD